jgi:hypothetical protein
MAGINAASEKVDGSRQYEDFLAGLMGFVAGLGQAKRAPH